jgi:hypothetical protein
MEVATASGRTRQGQTVGFNLCSGTMMPEGSDSITITDFVGAAEGHDACW